MIIRTGLALICDFCGDTEQLPADTPLADITSKARRYGWHLTGERDLCEHCWTEGCR